MTDKERIEELEKQVRQLQHRCFVLSKGILCTHCGFNDCVYRETVLRKMNEVE